jgi:hypothetical protein
MFEFVILLYFIILFVFNIQIVYKQLSYFNSIFSLKDSYTLKIMHQ